MLPGTLHLSKCCVRVESGQNWNAKCVSAGGTLPNSFLLFLNYEVQQGRHVWTRVKLLLHSASYCPTGCQPITDVRQVQRESLLLASFFFSLCLKSALFSNYKRHYFILQQFVQGVIQCSCYDQNASRFIVCKWKFDVCRFLNSEQTKCVATQHTWELGEVWTNVCLQKYCNVRSEHLSMGGVLLFLKNVHTL